MTQEKPSKSLPFRFMRRRPASGEGRWQRRLLYGLAFGLLTYVAFLLARGAPLEVRVTLLRYGTLLGTGVLAVAVPHVLLPDPQLPLMQLLNAPPPTLLRHQLRAWTRVIGLFPVPLAVLAFYDTGGFGRHLLEKSTHFAESLLIVGGTGLYTFAHYATIGRVSQAWQEGHYSAWYRFLKEQSTQGGFGVPDGLAPAITASGRLFLVAVLTLAASAYAGELLILAMSLVPGALLTLAAGVKLFRLQSVYDRHFYSTSAFYSEIFRSAGSLRGEGRAPVAYAAVYWAPHRWRPHVWAGIRQLDRRLPMGRLVALGHLLLWILFMQGAAPGVIEGYLLLFIAAQNAACYALITPALAPPAFQVTLQPPLAWTVTRFFVNLRWTMPLVLSLLVVALLDGGFRFADVLLWTGVDLLLGLVAAGLVTYTAEIQYRKHYA